MDQGGDIKDSKLKERKTGKDDFIIKMEDFTMGIGLITKCKDMENYILLLVNYLIREIG